MAVSVVEGPPAEREVEVRAEDLVEAGMAVVGVVVAERVVAFTPFCELRRLRAPGLPNFPARPQ